MKNPIPMLLGLLALLLWGGTNYYSKNCNCNAPILSSLDIPSLNLVDGSAFNGSSTSNLMFATSDFEARKPIDREVEKSFQSTSHYSSQEHQWHYEPDFVIPV